MSRPPRALCVVVAAGCVASADDSGAGALPAEETADSGAVDTSPETFTFDTSLGDTATDVSPTHTLTMTHTGEWLMSPTGGPWTAVTGTLSVTEVVDGQVDEPTCAVTFALTGQSSPGSCASCDATFEILHDVSAGDRSTCRDPELPADGATLRMGWSDREGAILLDYQGSGVWLPWYQGARAADRVTFSWSQTTGVVVEDDAG